ncbi:GNAT family N-acetyltransferase, partial [Staphylococcus xylosus]|uniref:GNAT family N-acetyltransferase n=1 Tax=Staphylococcus xylosus TaxID=1288 RepID=UPI0030BABBE9
IISLGVKYLYQRKGIGQALINAAEAWALNRHIRRLEASIVPENQSAVRLFKSLGFIIEGELRDKLFINGKYYSKYVLGKLLI